MQVVILTLEQKEQLVEKQFTIDSYFNPIQDLNDNWIISIQEVTQCTNPEFLWIKELPLIEFEPKINEI